MLTVEIPEHLITDFKEIIEVEDEDGPGKPYCEFCIPADLVNRHGPAKLHSHEFSGNTMAELREAIDNTLRARSPGAIMNAARMQEAFEFLERHGLFAGPEEKGASVILFESEM